MENLSKLKIELIRKLIDARLSPSEREEVIKKAKELIKNNQSTNSKPNRKLSVN